MYVRPSVRQSTKFCSDFNEILYVGKYDALSSPEKSVAIETNTHKQTVNDISAPCLLACVGNEEIMSLSTYV